MRLNQVAIEIEFDKGQEDEAHTLAEAWRNELNSLPGGHEFCWQRAAYLRHTENSEMSLLRVMFSRRG
jgi:hypothetical protein